MSQLGSARWHRLESVVGEITAELGAANAGRETALRSCRRAIQLAGSSIKAVHRLEREKAADLADQCEVEIRAAQAALTGFPALQHAGFLHDAEKEYVEARVTTALVDGLEVPSPRDLEVEPAAWMKGVAEAASELRRHLLDRLRDGDLERASDLLDLMDESYDALMVVDFPDALTGGLRRTLDALRAVLERSRGDLTASVVQSRLQRAIEEHGLEEHELEEQGSKDGRPPG
jgi:translin